MAASVYPYPSPMTVNTNFVWLEITLFRTIKTLQIHEYT